MSEKIHLKTYFFFETIQKYLIEILLGILIISLFLSHMQWILNNDLLVFEVNQEHIPKAMFYYKHLSVSFHDFSEAYSNIKNSDYWPLVRSPLIYVFTGTINCLIGFSVLKMQSAFFLFFLILVLFTYLTAWRMQDKETGLLAAALVSLNPLVFHYANVYNQDLPLAAMVISGFYFLILNADFKRIGYSLWLGIIFGLGILTKPTFIVYLFAPLMLCIFDSLRKEKRVIKNTFNVKVLINIFLFFAVFIIIAWVWFGSKLKWLLPNCHYEFLINRKDDVKGVESLFYLFEFWRNSGPVFLILFFASIPGFIKHKGKSGLLLISGLVFSCLFLTLISNKQIRFALPIMPALAIISAVGICRINRSCIKKTAIVFLISLLVCQFVYVSFFYKYTAFPFKMIDAMVFAKSHNPPQVYWNSLEGREYTALFEKVLGNNTDEQIQEISRQYRYLKDPHAADYKIVDDFRLSFKQALQQYLLFKKPALLIRSLTDEELMFFFVATAETNSI